VQNELEVGALNLSLRRLKSLAVHFALQDETRVHYAAQDEHTGPRVDEPT
jgi:hypothetical protein